MATILPILSVKVHKLLWSKAMVVSVKAKGAA